jgi:DNA-binding transcriptional MerR regulator
VDAVTDSGSKKGSDARGKAVGRDKRRDGLLTTGDVARLSGNTLRTVRFYEEVGLIHPEQRSDGGHRLFCKEQLDRIRFITALRAAALSLDEIRAALDTPEKAADRSAAAAAMSNLLDQHALELGRRAESIEAVRQQLLHVRDVLARCAICARTGEHCDVCTNLAAAGEAGNTARMLMGGA